MISFWRSADKLAAEGIKVAWFGVTISIIGRIFSDRPWLFWVGIGTTGLGLVLRQRAEHLRRVLAAPRKLLPEQKSILLARLQNVSKAPIEIQFIGHDSETQQFAKQIADVFHAAGFEITNVCGAIAFEPLTGLSITLPEWDGKNATASGIRDAFAAVGLPMRLNAVLKQKESAVHLCVYPKPKP